MIKPNEGEALFQIVDNIKKSKNILIACHVNPDGDTVGSQLALFLALKKINKNVVAVSSDQVPEMFGFLPIDNIVTIASNKNTIDYSIVDTLITMECPRLDRTGGIYEKVKNIKNIINIDHHISNSYFGNINYVDDKVSAVGEQIYKIINKLEVEVDKDIATCLYVSILTDTGSFSYSNTTPETHLIAADLLKHNIDPFKINNLIYENNSFGKFRLLSKVLESISISKDGLIAWIVLTREMLESTGTQESESDGFVNYPRSIKGVEVSILFRETEDGKVRVSLRSNGKINVNEVVRIFNGGGHERAAGCTISDNLDNAKKLILKQIEHQIK